MIFPRFFRKNTKRSYLDFAAATPLASEVAKAMTPYFGDIFANPSAIHQEGVRARIAVENARTDIARTLRIRADDIIFTSGGTEANNLGIVGVIEHAAQSGCALSDMEIITTRIEHPSVLEAVRALEKRGVLVTFASVDGEGRIEMDAFEKLLSPKTVLVAVSYVNSEIGVVQDVKRITRIVRKKNDTEGGKTLVLLDAAQAPLWLPCQVDALGVDLMTLDAGKCYGPKGVGVLVQRARAAILPQTFGGSQEKGLRAGTENTPLIVGCAAALVRAQNSFESRAQRAQHLQETMITQIEKDIPDAVVNGSREHRVPNNVNISIPGIESEFAVITLDAAGIAASTRSACSGADGSGSYVVREIAESARAHSTIRFTFGEETTEKEVLRAVRVLTAHVAKMRAFQN